MPVYVPSECNNSLDINKSSKFLPICPLLHHETAGSARFSPPYTAGAGAGADDAKLSSAPMAVAADEPFASDIS